MDERSLQETYAPAGTCFGCGPANPAGLHIRSFAEGDEVVATWTPEDHHQAWPGTLAGGVIGALMDCHCNWTAAFGFMRRDGLDRPPATVTAEYAVKLLRPTPMDGPVRLAARVVALEGPRAIVEATMTAAGTPTATCRGTFVAVKPGHPAFHRW